MGKKNIRLAVICCNYGSIQDGIGHYTKKIISNILENEESIDIEIFTGNTVGMSRKELVYSSQMSKALYRMFCRLVKDEFNYVLLEYPFHEWNPLILILLALIKVVIVFKKVKFIL